MASRRSPAAYHSRTASQRRDPRGHVSIRNPQLRCFAACSGFHDIGPAPRNPQLILNLLPFVAAWLPYHNAQSTITSFACVRGCVATARRHSLLRLPFFCCASLHMSSYLKTCSSCLLVKKTCSSCLLVKKHGFMSSCQKKTWLHVRHANIVQTVKSCYKIKINYRESKSRFYGILLSKQHQCLTIAPLLQSNSATIRV